MERLTRKEIANIIGMTETMLGGYLKIDEVRQLMAPEGARQSYPESSLPLFHRLNALHRSKDIRHSTNPETILMLLKAGDGMENQKPISGPQTLVPSAQVPTVPPSPITLEQFQDAVRSGVIAALRDILPELLPGATTPPKDDFLTAPQAAARLFCSVRSIHRRTGIQPVRRRPTLYRESDIQTYIRNLQPIPPKVQPSALPAISPPPEPEPDAAPTEQA